MEDDVAGDWRAFVLFGTESEILFQDDHTPQPPTSQWKKGQSVEVGPHVVHIPPSLRAASVNVYLGLFDPRDIARRVHLPGCDGQRRVLAGRLHLAPELKFEPHVGPDPLTSGPFVRSDNGWAEGMHPTDVFLKNTQEVLGPLQEATAHVRLTRFEFLSPDRSLRRAVYGEGADATEAIANLGGKEAQTETRLGGRVTLPPWGFVIAGPRFAAFYATQWGGRAYQGGALFTIRPGDGQRLPKAATIRVFHGFGDPVLMWRGTAHEVRREQTLGPLPSGS